MHIQACRVNSVQPIRYTSNEICEICQHQTINLDSNNNSYDANNNTRIDGESDDGNGEQMLLKYEEPTDNERRNDVSTPTSDVCIIYSSTREHRIILTTQYCIKSISDTDSDEIKLSPTISNSERRVQNDAETGIILHVSSDVPIHDIRFRVDKRKAALAGAVYPPTKEKKQRTIFPMDSALATTQSPRIRDSLASYWGSLQVSSKPLTSNRPNL